MNEFLNQRGWSVVEPIAGDASARRYFRVEKDGSRAILMDDSAGVREGNSTLAGFIRAGDFLRKAGLKAPEIFEADEGAGYLLLEDLGAVSLSAAMAGGEDPEAIYELALEVLVHLEAQSSAQDFPIYRESQIHENRRQLIDWYVPAVRGEDNSDGLVEDYLAVWDEIEKDLPPCPQGFVHGDYHLENLMWLPQETGLKRIGLIDFQDSMHGPVPYDMLNLLEDARVDVSQEIKDKALAGRDEVFLAWYRVLAAQFHGRVLGLFIKLAVEDGKDQYLVHIPRLEAYMRENLEHPVLKPLKDWFVGAGVDFASGTDFNSLVAS